MQGRGKKRREIKLWINIWTNKQPIIRIRRVIKDSERDRVMLDYFSCVLRDRVHSYFPENINMKYVI